MVDWEQNTNYLLLITCRKAVSFWLRAGKLRLSGYVQESWRLFGYIQESRVFLVTCRKAVSFWLHSGKLYLSGYVQESRVFLVTCWKAMSFWLHAGKLCLLFTWDGPEKRRWGSERGWWGWGWGRVVIECDVVGCVSREQV